MTTPRAVLAAIVASTVWGCRQGVPPAGPATPLPPIPVYEITPNADSSRLVIAPAPALDPLAAPEAQRRVTLTARDAEARTLLLWLAEESGVNLVVSPDVRARVTVNFVNLPAAEAMRAIMSQAGLSVLAPGAGTLWPPVVFFQPPVNINDASAETIAARLGVSAEMARWIVETRPRP